MTQTNTTAGNDVNNNPIYLSAKTEILLWHTQGITNFDDMTSMIQCISPDYSEDLDDPQIDKKRGLIDLYLKLDNQEIDLDTFSSQAIDLWADQITDSSKLTDDDSTDDSLSEADKSLIDMLSKEVYDSNLAAATAYTNKLDDLSEYLTSIESVLWETRMFSDADRHLLNIQVVFANYIAGDHSNEDKNERLQTQLWLIKKLMLFQRESSNISKLRSKLIDLIGKIEMYNDAKPDLSNN